MKDRLRLLFDQWSLNLLSTAPGSGTAGLGTGIRRAAGLNRNPATNRAWDATNFGFGDLAGNAGGLGNHLRFANLTAGGVGNAAGPNFLGHGAGGVRNLLGDRFTGPRAGRVGNSLADCFAGP